MKKKVFVPFSPRSFAGIVKDVFEYFLGDRAEEYEIVALVLEGEIAPTNCRSVTVRRNGTLVETVEVTAEDIAVVNGGPTELGWVAAHLKTGVHLNVQRDGVTVLKEW